jgi:hypothetical protein
MGSNPEAHRPLDPPPAGSSTTSGSSWIGAVGVKTAYIERGSPWENGFIESFSARLRDELLDGEIFYSACSASRTS